MSSLTEITAALVAGAGTIGAGIAFVWNKVEQRFKEIENQLLECDKREREGQERRISQLAVIELLWQEVQRLAPDASVLKRAKKLLDDLKSNNS